MSYDDDDDDDDNNNNNNNNKIWNNGEKMISRWIDIMCGFLQGDSYSPVGFCISECASCASCYSRVKDIGWEHLEFRALVKHTVCSSMT